MTTNAAQEALAAALQGKLRALVESPLTPKTLHEIEQTAALAKQLLAIGKPGASLGRRHVLPFNQGLIAAEDIDDPDGAPLVSSPRAETFGATVIREAVSAYAEIMSRPRPAPAHELILAIQYAKGHEMHDLAKRLETKLEESLGVASASLGVAIAAPVDHETIRRAMDAYAPPPVDPTMVAPVGAVMTDPRSVAVHYGSGAPRDYVPIAPHLDAVGGFACTEDDLKAGGVGP
jgi:hypothetical protein